jgi:hypothetical protein
LEPNCGGVEGRSCWLSNINIVAPILQSTIITIWELCYPLDASLHSLAHYDAVITPLFSDSLWCLYQQPRASRVEQAIVVWYINVAFLGKSIDDHSQDVDRKG